MTETHSHRQQHGGYLREEGWRLVKGNVGQYLLMEGDWTWCGGNMMQFADHVSCHPKNVILNKI